MDLSTAEFLAQLPVQDLGGVGTSAAIAPSRSVAQMRSYASTTASWIRR